MPMPWNSSAKLGTVFASIIDKRANYSTLNSLVVRSKKEFFSMLFCFHHDANARMHLFLFFKLFAIKMRDSGQDASQKKEDGE